VAEGQPFENRVAIVTGASSGIGRAIAVALAALGAETCAVARRRPELEALAAEALEKSGRVRVCCADLTSEQDIQGMVETIRQEFGRVDVLVSCGGAISHNPLEKASLADFDLLYRSNLRGHYALVQAALPLLRQARGQIVFINSSAGLRAAATAGQFAATQHALRAIADSLREEVNSDGIRVLSVYPGRTATPRMEGLFAKEGRAYRPELLMQPEDVAAMVVHALLLPARAEVTEISMRPALKSY
jgi:NADP-dependent 3-hydroxy acid dehydrogenase YdfG